MVSSTDETGDLEMYTTHLRSRSRSHPESSSPKRYKIQGFVGEFWMTKEISARSFSEASSKAMLSFMNGDDIQVEEIGL